MTQENAIRFMELFIRKASESEYEFSNKDEKTGKVKTYQYAKLSISNHDYHDTIQYLLKEESERFQNLIQYFQIESLEECKNIFYESVDKIIYKYHLPIKKNHVYVMIPIDKKLRTKMELTFMKEIFENSNADAEKQHKILEMEMEEFVERYSYENYFAQIYERDIPKHKKLYKKRESIPTLSY